MKEKRRTDEGMAAGGISIDGGVHSPAMTVTGTGEGVGPHGHVSGSSKSGRNSSMNQFQQPAVPSSSFATYNPIRLQGYGASAERATYERRSGPQFSGRPRKS